MSEIALQGAAIIASCNYIFVSSPTPRCSSQSCGTMNGDIIDYCFRHAPEATRIDGE